jgi:toxin ParE1/3/4
VKRLKLRDEAERDLFEIWMWIALDDPAAADRVIDRIQDVMFLLCEQPGSGRPRPEFGDGLRSFPAANWVIFYREDGPVLDVARVLHGRRDLDGQL